MPAVDAFVGDGLNPSPYKEALARAERAEAERDALARSERALEAELRECRDNCAELARRVELLGGGQQMLMDQTARIRRVALNGEQEREGVDTEMIVRERVDDLYRAEAERDNLRALLREFAHKARTGQWIDLTAIDAALKEPRT